MSNKRFSLTMPYGRLDFVGNGSNIQSLVAAAADLLQTVYEAYPREEAIAFLLADLKSLRDLPEVGELKIAKNNIPQHAKKGS